MMSRYQEIHDRDEKAPDNAINVQDVEDLDAIRNRDKPEKSIPKPKVEKKEYNTNSAEHKKGARNSTENKHQKGQATNKKNQGGEKKDGNMPYRNK